ncbi:hypothetical protein Y032_0009g812 [Ancylostoma ceylanicum]|uniref:Uncharacterized protein n=1 Tax=Ancylostoma ceylanicum TaxID=53326 RepID=A0A016VLH4_9BILA|nr:hypothetical protein Y032_0009g812 [Ancylostoma ceylanicum]
MTLKSLIDNFKEYAKPPTYSDDDRIQYEETLHSIDLIKGSMTQVESAKSNLQALVDKMKNGYDNTKNEDEEKNILQGLEKIEEETKFTDVMSEAIELNLMIARDSLKSLPMRESSLVS